MKLGVESHGMEKRFRAVIPIRQATEKSLGSSGRYQLERLFASLRMTELGAMAEMLVGIFISARKEELPCQHAKRLFLAS
jgi:hypothetical protein